MIRDDYPVFQEIAILQQQLQPIRLTFNHVDGHLDKKEKTTDSHWDTEHRVQHTS